MDRNKNIISCTDKEICEKELLSIPDEFFHLKNGEGISGVTELGGRYYAVGARASSGYREYKSETDSYKNDVIAFMFSPLGEVIDPKTQKEKQPNF